jgi:hypothetical protein
MLYRMPKIFYCVLVPDVEVVVEYWQLELS